MQREYDESIKHCNEGSAARIKLNKQFLKKHKKDILRRARGEPTPPTNQVATIEVDNYHMNKKPQPLQDPAKDPAKEAYGEAYGEGDDFEIRKDSTHNPPSNLHRAEKENNPKQKLKQKAPIKEVEPSIQMQV